MKSHVVYKHDKQRGDFGTFVKDTTDKILRHPPETWSDDLYQKYLALTATPCQEHRRVNGVAPSLRRLVEVWVEQNEDSARRWKPHKRKDL